MISSTLLCTALIHCITGLLAFRFTWSTFRRANLGLRYLYVSAATVELSLLVLMVFQTLSTDLTRIIKYELVIITIFASVMIPMGLGFLGGQKSLARKALISLSIIFLYNLVSVYLAAWVAHVPIWSFKMSHHISRTAITGVIISSSLAGYGSIEFPLKYWELLFSYVSYSSISDVKNRLIAVVDERNHVANQMETIRRIYKLPKSDDFQRGFSSPLIDSNAISSFYDEEHDTVASTRSQRRLSLTDIHVLRQEFQTLENLATDLTLTLDTMTTTHARYMKSQTTKGRFLNLVAWVMVTACIYRVFTAVINVVFQRVAAVDPVTVFLENILGTMKVELDITTWAAYINLVYVGSLVWMTISSFKAQILTVIDRATGRLSQTAIMLLVGEIQSIYVCACVLMLRANLSLEQRIRLENLLGDIDFERFHLQYDLVFAISCLLCVLGVAFTKRRQNWKIG